MISDHFFLVATIILLMRNALIVTSSQQEKRPDAKKISEAPADHFTEPKAWTREAIVKMWTERDHMGSTPIHVITPPGLPAVRFVFKNESATRTQSLKHRYSWALMMWALLEQHVQNGTHVFEASSGNTACSLGYFCKLIGVKFTSIVPDTIETVKVRRIEEQGGSVVRVPISDRLIRAEQLARESGGFFMNQFKNAFYAEEFHESGNSEKQSVNIMHEVVQQLTGTPPHYFVHSAGTGGTLSSIGRYAKKYGLSTQIVLADTEFSVYYDYVVNGSFVSESGASQWIAPGMAGIGYGTMGPAKIAETTSLDPAVIDRALKIPDLASTAAMQVARDIGIDGGTSTAVNFLSALHIASSLPTSPKSPTQPVVIATILADSGKFYESTYLNRSWIEEKFRFHGGLKVYYCWIRVIRRAYFTGNDPLEQGRILCSNV
ncbi:unnamed protein product [Caenorhabditis sp. 36 PRJEB53466]|nr:unnamed protein product [Caenorhabditis sp. 36 PRJEB53466]